MGGTGSTSRGRIGKDGKNRKRSESSVGGTAKVLWTVQNRRNGETAECSSDDAHAVLQPLNNDSNGTSLLGRRSIQGRRRDDEKSVLRQV